MIRYPTTVEALAIHAIQIERYAGASGVRDMGLLESALFRPQTGYYADLIAEAAALWESLSHNHPLVDGNKRTAFGVTYTFLRLNGVAVVADATTAITDICGFYERGEFSFGNLEAWLRANTARV